MSVTVLNNITKCCVIKKLPLHIMLKLPTNQVIFYPSRLIKILDVKSLAMIFFDGTQFKTNRVKLKGNKWVRYNQKDLKSEEIIRLILKHDTGARKC